MLVTIEGVLQPPAVAQLRERLQAAHWVDGAVTAGALAGEVKRNRQCAIDSEEAVIAADIVESALRRHPEFITAALPRRMVRPRFNAYGIGEYYGAHVDASIMEDTRGGGPIRTDVSVTLFLSEPEDYAGGELEIETGFGMQQVKLNAGDAVVYPASSLHRVAPVTRGERVASFLWVESLVSSADQRALLYDMDCSIRRLRQTAGNAESVLALSGVYHNLMRMFAAG
ncbi:MAG: Fe2+-dependent dioxygenase [Gammaproteobacteria bacterium]|nr:Fe2+-dependent dioxygenase [Gammaproteobacteria bacterium]